VFLAGFLHIHTLFLTTFFWKIKNSEKIKHVEKNTKRKCFSKMFITPMNDIAILYGTTENAGVKNAIRSKTQGWKMQEHRLAVYGKPN